jgi:hypothetical protein
MGFVLASVQIVLLALAPQLVFVALFSAMGYGLEIHEILESTSYLSAGFLSLAVAFLFLLYILDAGLWESPVLLVVKRVSLLFIFLEVYAAFFTLGSNYPYAPMTIFLVAQFLLMVYARTLLTSLEALSSRRFLTYMSSALLITSSFVLAWWIVWVFVLGNPWGKDTELEYAQKLGCNLGVSSNSSSNSTSSNGSVSMSTSHICEVAFLRWCSPLLVVAINMGVAITAFVVANADHERDLVLLGLGYGFVLSLVTATSTERHVKQNNFTFR